MSEPILWTNCQVRLGDLKKWEDNPAEIGKAAAVRLAESFNEFGQVQALAIDPDNRLIDGHQRLDVWIHKFGADMLVDCRRSSRSLTLKERQKIAVYLRSAAVGKYNWDVLANWDSADLQAWGFDDKTLGDWQADTRALENFIGSNKPPLIEDAEPQIDKAEELRVKWGVESGQLWQLGEHRLICGDCTDKINVNKLFGSEKAAIMFTSPPYNAGVSAQLSGNTSIDDNLYKDEYDDNKSQSEYLDILNKFTDVSFDVSEYQFVNIQVLAGNKRAFIEYLFTYADKFADVAIWNKEQAAPAQAQRVMDSCFEFVLVFSQKATRAIGTRDFRGMVHNVYNGKPQRNNEYASSHAATFPVDFPEHFIGTFTNPSELVYEPFCGTGTTIIACERLGRKCRAIEISPAYVAVAIQRWVDVTGGEPVLLES